VNVKIQLSVLNFSLSLSPCFLFSSVVYQKARDTAELIAMTKGEEEGSDEVIVL
jgi:hypothetical protein